MTSKCPTSASGAIGKAATIAQPGRPAAVRIADATEIITVMSAPKMSTASSGPVATKSPP
jgi:hypothetical protein